jgi:hypothetical protein
MKSEKSKVSATGNIPAFVKLVQQGVDAWVAAGELLVVMLKEDSNIFDKVIAEAGWIDRGMLWNFYKIGTKQIYPKALLTARAPVSEMLVSMPYALQKQVCDNPVPVVVGVKEQRPVVQNKAAGDLSTREARQVFDGHRMRDAQEQAVWLGTQQLKTRTAAPALRPAPPTGQCSLGLYKVTMDSMGQVRWEKYNGHPVPAVKVALAPHNGNWVGLVELTRPKAL